MKPIIQTNGGPLCTLWKCSCRTLNDHTRPTCAKCGEVMPTA